MAFRVLLKIVYLLTAAVALLLSVAAIIMLVRFSRRRAVSATSAA